MLLPMVLDEGCESDLLLLAQWVLIVLLLCVGLLTSLRLAPRSTSDDAPEVEGSRTASVFDGIFTLWA